jgi:hypothetical protein
MSVRTESQYAILADAIDPALGYAYTAGLVDLALGEWPLKFKKQLPQVLPTHRCPRKGDPDFSPHADRC